MGDRHLNFYETRDNLRSPDPHHLAVLARPGFVRAAPTRSGISRSTAALSFTSLLRQGRRRRSLTSTQIVSASRRTWIEAKTPRHSLDSTAVSHHRLERAHNDGSSERAGEGGVMLAVRPDKPLMVFKREHHAVGKRQGIVSQSQDLDTQ